MSIGILGKKVGMTRIFDDAGVSSAVTVIEAAPNVITQVKTEDKDGYKAVQLGVYDKKDKRATKAEQGHFKKAGTAPKRFVREFRTEDEFNAGDTVSVTNFEVGMMVDVIGTTKGRGFQGVMRRWNFQGQGDGHGSMMHRRPGSIGPGSTPGHVYKNQKMPGHMGNTQRGQQNLKIMQIREADNVILIKGSVPGPNGGYVIVRPAIKGQPKVQEGGKK